MNTTGKIVGGIVLAGGAYLVYRLVHTGGKLSINVASINSPSFRDGAVVLSVNATVDNPTSQSLRIKKPYLTIDYNGNEIANSKTSDEYIAIKANDRAKIKDLNIQVPFLKLGAAMIKLVSGQSAGITLDVTVHSEIGGVAFSQTKHINL